MNIVLQRQRPRFTGQTALSIPPEPEGRPRPAGQTPDTAPAPQNRKQNPARPAVSAPLPSRPPPIRHPADVKYAKTRQTAPKAPHLESAPQRCPAIPPAAPPSPASQKSHPAAAQTETRARRDRASARISPRDGTTRNAHRKKDNPRPAFLAPPKKHSTAHHYAVSCPANRDYGNDSPFPLATLSETL